MACFACGVDPQRRFLEGIIFKLQGQVNVSCMAIGLNKPAFNSHPWFLLPCDRCGGRPAAQVLYPDTVTAIHGAIPSNGLIANCVLQTVVVVGCVAVSPSHLERAPWGGGVGAVWTVVLVAQERRAVGARACTEVESD